MGVVVAERRVNENIWSIRVLRAPWPERQPGTESSEVPRRPKAYPWPSFRTTFITCGRAFVVGGFEDGEAAAGVRESGNHASKMICARGATLEVEQVVLPESACGEVANNFKRLECGAIGKDGRFFLRSAIEAQVRPAIDFWSRMPCLPAMLLARASEPMYCREEEEAGAVRVDGKQVAGLAARPFVVVMEQLLRAEAARRGLPQTGIHVSTNIDRRDHGVDGRVMVDERFASDRLPAGLGIWQFKSGRTAGDVQPATLRRILQKDGVANAMAGGARFTLALAVQIGDDRVKVEEALRSEAASLGYDPAMAFLYDADALAAWATEHPAVWQHFGIGLGGALAFETWRSGSADLRFPFVSDEARDQMRRQLQESLLAPSDVRVFCVRGISGVGKTRFVFDALDIDSIRSRVLFAASRDEARSVVENIVQNTRLATILVVDECDDEHVKWLVTQATICRERLRVVAIQGPLPSDRERLTSPEGIEYLSMQGFSREKMDELLRAVAATATAEQRAFVISIADGIPRIAVFFALALERDPNMRVSEVTLEQTFEAWTRRLVRDELSLDILRALAVATRVGWDAEAEVEGERWAMAYDLGPWRKVRDAADELMAVGLLRPQGRRHRYVWPHPLAVVLAARVWKAQGVRLVKCVETVGSSDFFFRFIERLRDISDSPNVRSVVEDILARSPAFSSLDALDPVDNADAFTLLAESAPEAGLVVLERLLANQPRDSVYRFAHSQRNTIELLARMAWRQRYFARAERLLRTLSVNDGVVSAEAAVPMQMYFAIEPSRDGPNARQRFSSIGVVSRWARLFAIRSASTAVHIRDRQSVLQGLLREGTVEERRIAILALSDSLSPGYTIGGMEILGSFAPEPQSVPTALEVFEASLRAWRMLSDAMDDSAPMVRNAAVEAMLKVSIFEIANGRAESVVSEFERRVSVLGAERVADRIRLGLTRCRSLISVADVEILERALERCRAAGSDA